MNYLNDPDSRRSDLNQKPFGYHKPGAAITSMVFGICSVSLWWVPMLTSIPCIIFGIIACRIAAREAAMIKPKYVRFVNTGRITGIIGIILSSLYTLIFAILFLQASLG